MAARPLKLRAVAADDLPILGACLQHGIAAIRDLRFDPAERRFALLVNRCRWEDQADGRPLERVLAALTVESVTRVRSRGLDRKAAGGLVELLTIAALPAAGGTALELTFAGPARLLLSAERIECRVEDLSEPWPASARPGHD